MTAASMTAPTTAQPRRSILSRDPLGLLAGWRAYRSYSRLSKLSDSALVARGLKREDLPALAIEMARKD